MVINSTRKTTPTDVTLPARLLQLLPAALIAGGAITGLTTIVTPRVAIADPPKTEAQAECTQDGDLYTTTTDAGGNTFEKCCYTSGVIVEMNHCDVWVNGKWNKDLSYKPVGPASPPPSPPPPGATAILPPGSNTRAGIQ
jgi:hypothetical protein